MRESDRDIIERRQTQNELQRAFAETEQMNRLMSGLEDRVLELKNKVNELLKNRGENKSMGG